MQKWWGPLRVPTKPPSQKWDQRSHASRYGALNFCSFTISSGLPASKKHLDPNLLRISCLKKAVRILREVVWCYSVEGGKHKKSNISMIWSPMISYFRKHVFVFLVSIRLYYNSHCDHQRYITTYHPVTSFFYRPDEKSNSKLQKHAFILKMGRVDDVF